MFIIFLKIVLLMQNLNATINIVVKFVLVIATVLFYLINFVLQYKDAS